MVHLGKVHFPKPHIFATENGWLGDDPLILGAKKKVCCSCQGRVILQGVMKYDTNHWTIALLFMGNPSKLLGVPYILASRLIPPKWVAFNIVYRTILCGRNSDCKVEQLQYIPEKKKNIWPNTFAGLFKISSPTFCGALWRLPCFAPVKRPSVTTIGRVYHWPWALWETSWLKMQESQPCLDVFYFFFSPSASKKFNLALWTRKPKNSINLPGTCPETNSFNAPENRV